MNTFDFTVRNQVLLERLKAGEAKKFAPFLKDIEKKVRLRLGDEGESIRNKGRLNSLLVDISNIQRSIYEEYQAQLIGDLSSIAVQQSEFEAKSYTSLVANFEAVVPTEAQILAAVRLNPMQIQNYSGTPLLEPFFKNWSSSEMQRIRTAVQQGFYQGQTTSEIVSRLRGSRAARYADGDYAITSRSNRTIVRTMVQHASTQARSEVMSRNSDLIKGYEWVSTLDSRTSSQCASLDGREFKNGQGPLPPIHPNCVLGHTTVSTCSDVSKLFKRGYKGLVVDIVTKSGSHLSITPNHPILTARGWVNAGDINSLDKLAVVNGRTGVSYNHKNSVKAKISDIFCAANISVDAASVSNRPVSSEHFHGDGVTDTNVDIVDVDSKTWSDVKSSISDNAADNWLINGKGIKRALKRFCSFNFTMPANLTSSGGDICVTGNSFLFGVSSKIHSCLLLLRSISKSAKLKLKESNHRLTAARETNMTGYSLCSYARIISIKNKFLFNISKRNNISVGHSDVICRENSLYGLISDTKSLAYFLHRKVVDSVELDDVCYIGTRKFNGHVYNLQNDEHWYLSNDIITHNCRSTITPVLSNKFDFLDEGATRPEKGASGAGQTSANTTYYSWLKRQPASFQDDAIGATRGKLLRNGGITSDEFAKLSLDRNFEALTLDEMRAKSPSVFERAGL